LRTESSSALDFRHRVFIYAMVIVGAFEGLAIITVLPKITEDLGRADLYGQVAAAYFAASLCGIGMSQILLKSPDCMRYIGIACALLCAGLILSACAPTMAVLGIGRIVQGLGGGVLSSYAYFAAGKFYPEESRPKIFASLATAWLVAGLLAPSISNLLDITFGWRSVFVVPAVIVVATLIVFGPRSRRLRAGDGVAIREQRTAVTASTVAGTGFTVVALAMLLAGPDGPFRLTMTALTVVGLVSTIVPAIDRTTLRLGSVAACLILVNLVVATCYFATESLIPLVFDTVRSDGTVIAGLVISAGSLLWSAGTWAQARVARRANRNILVPIGVAVTVFGLLACSRALMGGSATGLVAVAWWTATAGMGLITSYIAFVVMSDAAMDSERASTLLQASNLGASYLGASFFAGAVARRLPDDGASAAIAPNQLLMLSAVFVSFVVVLRMRGLKSHQASTR